MKIFMGLTICVIVSLLSFYLFASDHISDLKVGSCGNKNVSIFYKEKADYLIGCEGIERARNFFTRYGYAVDVPIRIYFRKRVFVNISCLPVMSKQVYGYYDPETMSVYTSSITSPFILNSRGVYLKIGYHEESGISKQQRRRIIEEFHKSAVAHEVAHLLAQHNFNLCSVKMSNPRPRMGHGVHEYIASIVQLGTMETTLRQRILQQYEPQLFFDREEQVNMTFYLCDPEKFTVMAFRHFYKRNKLQQRILLDRIFSHDLDPDRVSDIDY